MDIVTYPGDIFLVKGDSLLSKMIRVCTRVIGESRTQVNHAGIISTQARLKDTLCVEALSHVMEHGLLPMYKGNGQVAIYRKALLTMGFRRSIVEEARGYKGKTYGYLKLFTHFLDWMLLGSYVFRRLTSSDNYPICSWLVEWSYRKAGVDLFPEGSSPDDIWDIVTRKEEGWECVMPLTKLT